MKAKANARIEENVEIEIIDAKTGKLMHAFRSRNMVVDAGLDFIREAITRSKTPMGYIAAGDGSTAVTSADTTLDNELGRVGLVSYDDSSTGVVVLRAIFESDQANGNLVEFGIFNDATAGTMLARTVLGASFTKDETMMVRVNWTITFTDA